MHDMNSQHRKQFPFLRKMMYILSSHIYCSATILEYFMISFSKTFESNHQVILQALIPLLGLGMKGTIRWDEESDIDIGVRLDETGVRML